MRFRKAVARVQQKLQKPKGVNWVCFLVLGLAICVRLDLLNSHHVPPVGDFLEYVRLAENLIQHGYYGVFDRPDHKFPPAYPLLLASYAWLMGRVRVDPFIYQSLNFLLDCGSMVLLILLGARVTGKFAFVGIALIAVSPCWYSFVNLALTEPLSIFLFLCFLYFWLDDTRDARRLLASGIFVGLLALTRAQYLWFPLILVAVERFALLPLVRKARARMAPSRLVLQGWDYAWFLGSSYGLSLLYGIRNFETFGHFAFAQSDNGYKMAYIFTQMRSLDFKIPADVVKFNNLPLIKELSQASSQADAIAVAEKMKVAVLEYIRDNPLEYLAAIATNPVRLWLTGYGNPFSYTYVPEYLRGVFVWGFAAPVVFFGLIGLFRHGVLLFRAPASSDLIVGWRAICVQGTLFMYMTFISLPLLVEGRYSIVPFVAFSLWIGLAFESVTPRLRWRESR